MNERGGGKIQALFALAVTVVVVVAAVRIIPVYSKAIQFKSAMVDQAKMANVTRKPPDQIRDELFSKAKELDIPMKREQIQVNPMQVGVRIAVRFSIPVDLVVTQMEFSFDYQTDTSSAY